jgi:hypothetical protein
MEAIYEFSAHNSETVYGFGTEEEAAQYLEWLNQDKEIDLYEMCVSELTDDEAETLAVNLLDCLKDLDLVEYDDF